MKLANAAHPLITITVCSSYHTYHSNLNHNYPVTLPTTLTGYLRLVKVFDNDSNP